MLNVLIGDISSYKAIVVAKYLKRYYKCVNTLVYDYKKSIKNVHSKYCDEFLAVPNPESDRDYHLESLRRIIEEKHVDLFIPVHSDMYGEYVKKKEMFGAAFSYVNDFELFELLHDKRKFATLLAELNIKQPRAYDSLDGAKLPFIIKPPNLSSAKGVKYIFSEDDRAKYRKHCSKDMIIQEYVRGVGGWLFSVCQKG